MKIVTLFPFVSNQPQTAHVPLQRLIAMVWPHWVPRSVMEEIRVMIDRYFEEGEHVDSWGW